MSEEAKQELEQDEIVSEEVVENEGNESQAEGQDSQYSEIELKALDMGWRPKEEFDGNDQDWKGPGAFVKDAELFQALKKQDTEIKELKTVLTDLKGYISKSEESGYKRALKEIESQKQAAIESLDTEALAKVNEDYLELQQQMNSKKSSQSAEEPNVDHNAVQAFEQRNRDWYNANTEENSDMQAFAVVMSERIAATQPDLNAEQQLAEVEKRVKKNFPHRFKNQKRSEPSAVSSGGARSSKPKGIDKSGIDSRILQSAERFVRQGIFESVDQYLKDAKDKGII